MLKYLFLGFFAKIITGFDDTITHIPVLASVTKTRTGKIAFSIGTLLAIIAAIIIAMFFSSIIKKIPFYRYIIVGLIFILAALIYFDVFVHKPRTEAEKRLLKMKKISAKRFTKLLGIGFVASFATVLDDIIAYSPLFLGAFFAKFYAVVGILIGTVFEILLVIFFAEKIAKIKYKEEIASIGLVILGVLILLKIL